MSSTINAATSGGLISTGDTSGQLQLQTAGTTALTIDSSQNLGVGVTPSSWATYKAIDILGYASFSSYNGNEADMSTNAYYNAGWKYKNTAAATLYQQDTGVHRWQYAASGTAGNAITWTQAMTLTASGNLGIGTTSPTYGLDVQGSSNTSIRVYSPSYPSLRVHNSSTGTGNSDGLLIEMGGTDALIDNYEAGNLKFATNNIEAMRIDSSGKLLVNTTSTIGSGRLQVLAVSTNAAIDTQVAVDGSPVQNFRNSAGSQQGYVIVNTSGTVYSTTSDYRLKNTVAPMTGALAKVALLKPVTYKWNVDGSDSQGFIAHELQAVVPECVTGEKDAVDENGNPKYQGIDTSFLVATLTAAIQELSTQVTELKAEVQALKGA